MGLIDSGKYLKDLLSAYDDVSMEFEILDRQPLVNAIPIPEGATNGDVIKAMFPNCVQKEHTHKRYFEMYFDCNSVNASYMTVSKKWWNAQYKKGAEND